MKTSFPLRKIDSSFDAFSALLILLLLICGLSNLALAAGEVSVRVGVERQQVYQGESFIYQIQVRGTNKVEPAKFNSSADYDIQFMGGQDTSSRMVVNINGQITQNINESYNLNYRITPKHTGTITIPSVSIKAAGAHFQTQSVSVQVLKPEETEDFKLRMDLSQSKVYVGEPVTLTVTWYLGKDVRSAEFSVPALAAGGDFRIVAPEFKQEQGKRYLRLNIQGQEIIAEQNRGTLGGRDYTTIAFRRVLIPQKPGSFSLPASTVSCEALVGRRQRTIFDDFFSGNMGGEFQRVVAPSNSPRLEVLDVPAQGRPVNFSGNVGRFNIDVKAQPTSVKVGDPITLTMELSGPTYLESVKPPRLDLQKDLAENFKIPEEMSPGKITGNKILFTQTLRAKNPEVREIPPVELAYFDTKEKAYRVIKTKAIPIQVEATRVVTAWDAEGSGSRPEAKELQTLAGGISANFEGEDALIPQAFGTAGLLFGSTAVAAGLIPPVIFIGLWIFLVTYRKRLADPSSFMAKGAYRKLSKELKALVGKDYSQVCEGLLESVRSYLGAKLKRPASALTFAEVREPLQAAGVSTDGLSFLENLIKTCEAQHYAGQVEETTPHEMVKKAIAIATEIEKKVK